jgi:hypothetical protein
MNCYDCAAQAMTTPAVAICVDCGVALCLEHADVSARRLTRTAAVNRVIAVEPATRTIRCHLCEAATRSAAGRPEHDHPIPGSAITTRR